MNKKDIIKTLDIASFISAVVATILVFIFQFNGQNLVLKYSIIMYAVCFLTLAVMIGFKVHTVFSKKKTEDDVNYDVKQKTWVVIWFALAIVAFIFTVVLLAIY